MEQPRNAATHLEQAGAIVEVRVQPDLKTARHALIDTGAAHCAIGHRLAVTLKLATAPPAAMYGIHGVARVATCLAVVAIPSIRFSLSDRFIIMSPSLDGSEHPEVILGRPALRFLRLTYDGCAGTFSLSLAVSSPRAARCP